MLIEFTVKNYKSIRAAQKFSLVAAKGDELRESNTFIPGALASEPLLRSAVIYGPNASGKSNLLKALYAMQDMVVLSANLKAGKALPVIPFLLDDESASAPTEFEVVMIADGVRYQYGFAANSSQVLEEWLFASPKGRSQLWFSREWDAESKSHGWEFGKSFAGEKQLWQKSTRNNALFLTTAMQLNSKSLAPVFNWFAETLNIIGANESPSEYTVNSCKENQTRAAVLAFLQAADFDIADLTVQVEPFTENHIRDEVPADVAARILAKNAGAEMLVTYTTHQTRQGGKVEFRLQDESDGTRKVFAFAGPWLDTLKNGGILFIDELHGSLHPKLVHFLVGMFHNHQTNPHNAQLVFTTHDTSILNQEVFRRDQIWFFEKDRDQVSHLYPLTDFHPRKDRENLLANYLDGRYGALPVFGELAPDLVQQQTGGK